MTRLKFVGLLEILVPGGPSAKHSDAISRFHNRRYPIFFVRRSTLVRLKRELRLNMHAMKAIAIIALLLLVVVNALELLPAASAFQMYLSGGAVALSFVCELQSALGI